MKNLNKYRALGSLLCVIVGLLFSAALLHADITGTILGTVTDPSGAAVPGAEVRLRNTNVGLERSMRTDATGSFQFLLVAIGEGFSVEVSAPGFETNIQSGIKLLVNQAYRVDFHLQVGSVKQQISVSATPVQVESTSNQLGDVIEDQEMTSLPLNGRSYIDLLGLQVGVVPITSGTEVPGYFSASGDLFEGTLSVNGNRETSNGYLVNGGDVEEITDNGASVVPTLDSIQEFRVLTGAFDAEYGRFSGGLVNVVTKSGTNSFHGNLYEFLRNEKLDSRNFFDLNQTNPETGQELPGTAIGEFRQNQFGGTLGGRIIKDRLFFFSDYQGTRQVVGISTGVMLVPSALERTGNFSDVGTTGYPPLSGLVHGCTASDDNGHCMNDVLTQRLGYTVTNGEPYWVPGCNSLADAQAGTCVFPGQIIPQAAWSPAAAGTLKFMPTPTGSVAGTPFFSTSAFKYVVRDDKFGQRIDLNTQKTGNWSVYYHFDDATVINPYAGGNVPGFPGITPSRAQQINLSNTRNFGATTVNQWRLNFMRFSAQLSKSALPPEKVSDFGFVEGGQGIIPSDPSIEGVPPIGLDILGTYYGTPVPIDQFSNTYQALDNFSKIAGKHTLKVGADGRYFNVTQRVGFFPNGQFAFPGQETGNDFADYLLGTPYTYLQSSPGTMYPRSKYFGVYGQDSYKLRPNFTLNYGLRWEFSNPWYDARDELQVWKPGLQSKRYPDSPTGLVFDGDPGIPRTGSPTTYDNFAPRIGIAYSPGFTNGLAAKLFGGPHMTSVRASYGIFYSVFEQQAQWYEMAQAPFTLWYEDFSTPVYLEEPFKGRTGIDPGQRFPYVPVPEGTSNLAEWAAFQPITATVIATDNVLPRVENYDFSIQRQLSSSTLLTLGYVGTQGHHLFVGAATYDANPANRALCLQVRQILGPANGCGPFGEDSIYTLPNGQMVYGTRPYSVTSGRLLNHNPPLLDMTWMPFTSTQGNSNYNALEVTVEKRAGPVRMLAAYTWSKSLDDNPTGMAIDSYNLHVKHLSSFDMAQDIVFSYTVDLPFQKLAHSTSGPVHKFLDGWEASGITRFATGLGVGLSDSSDLSLCGDSCTLPNYNGQPLQFYNPRASSDHRYFSTSQFSEVAMGALGTANGQFFHGPGLNNWDFALHKMTHVTEGTSVEFRAEFFNLGNHAQFTNPGGNSSSPAFGLVTSARDPRIGQLALKFNF